jgi:hypothetical protein
LNEVCKEIDSGKGDFMKNPMKVSKLKTRQTLMVMLCSVILLVFATPVLAASQAQPATVAARAEQTAGLQKRTQNKKTACEKHPERKRCKLTSSHKKARK